LADVVLLTEEKSGRLTTGFTRPSAEGDPERYPDQR
jgi:hypothetical protein